MLAGLLDFFFFSHLIFCLVCSGTVCIGEAELTFDSFLLFTRFQNKLVHWNPPMQPACHGFLRWHDELMNVHINVYAGRCI